MDDRQVRDAAVRARTNVVVTAGAGTGKTTLLVDAVLSRLLDDAVDIRRILMLTFTEKAANEMRIRVRQALEKRERTERVANALAGLDRTLIGTIHGFCAHLLREFPVEAGVDPHFTVDEGPRLREIFDHDWERWLEGELASDSPRREAWLRLLSIATLEEARGVAWGLCSFHVPEWALDPAGSRERGRAALAAAREHAADQVEEIAACGRPTNWLVEQMRQVARYLRHGGDASVLGKNPSKDRRGWRPEDFSIAESVQKDAFAFANDIAEMDEERVGEALALLSDFARRFRTAYTAAGCASFDGLLTLAHALLTSETFPAIRARVRERFDVILVDEFQDTDPVQCEIITRLAEGSDGKLVPGRLFIVGDPKQSIYSFRGADIVAYQRVRQRMIEDGAQEFVLRTNFRSHAGILDVVNGIFSRVIEQRSDLQPAYEPIAPEPGRGCPKGPTVELVLIEKEEGRLLSPESRRAEAEAIADWIARQAPFGRRRDVAILLKALTDAHVYLEALRERDIQYVVEGEKFFYGSPEVIDFSNLLAAIANPNDAVALAGLLRSPLGAVEDRELYELKLAGALDWRATPEDPRLARLYATLRRLHERSRQVTVAGLIDEIFGATFVLELAAASTGGEQAVANLHKLREKARDLDPRDLRAFLKIVQQAVRTIEEEGESPLADETLDAVRVMSIHKAKGLEFPIVILPDLHRQAEGRHEEPAVRFDWPTRTLGVRLGARADAGAAALAYREAERRREEDKRVPYVALTRPRERLLMLGSGRFSKASLLGLMAHAIQAAGGPSIEAFEGTVQVGEGRIELRRSLWQEREPRERRSEAAAAPAEDWASLATLWRRREEEYARALKTPWFARPSQLKEKPAAVAPDEDGRREAAARVGTLCHRALEKVDFRKPRFEVEGTGPEADEARAILAAFAKTDAFAELARAHVVARELPFVMKSDPPSPSAGRPEELDGLRRAGGAIVSGAIDVVYRVGKELWVADYKSDAAEDPAQYREQGRAYLEAVERILGTRPAGFKLIYLRSGRIVNT